MKFNFLKAVVAGFILSISGFVNVANAGLIKNGLEWLDLSIVGGKTVEQVHSTVLNQAQYSDYRYATQSEADEFWSDYFLSSWSTATSGVWHTSEGLVDSSYQDFLSQAYVHVNFFTHTLSTEEGTIQFDRIWDGIYIFDNGIDDNSSSSYWTYAAGITEWEAILKYMPNADQNIGIRLRTQEVPNDRGPNRNMNHLLVKNIEVPEPSTLTIFALGMMGLLSRIFKKQ